MSARVVKMKTKAPAAPDYMSANAAEHWKQIVPVLQARGMFTPERMPAIHSLCVEAGAVRSYEETLKTEPVVVKTSTGIPKPHPLVNARTKAAHIVTTLSKSLGLIGAQAPRPDKDKGQDALSELGLD